MDNPIIIFLDFDGVLTSNRTWYAEFRHIDKKPFEGIDTTTIRFLHEICERFECKIVLSTSWAKFAEVDMWKYLEKYDLIKHVYGDSEQDCYTPILGGGNRNDEIYMWLKEHDWLDKQYIIIDDDDSITNLHKEYWVKPNIENGMLMEHYRKVEFLIYRFIKERDRDTYISGYKETS